MRQGKGGRICGALMSRGLIGGEIWYVAHFSYDSNSGPFMMKLLILNSAKEGHKVLKNCFKLDLS